jgi:hypothetical protein
VSQHAGAPARTDDIERWFVGHGLPWFIDAEDARIARLLTARRLWPVGLGIVVAAVLVGAVASAAAAATGDAGHRAGAALGTGLVAALWAAGGLAGVYALTALRGWAIARWAARRALGDLGLVVPLVTRALPLLLLFTTFLFINTEVWQVSSELDRSLLWATVLLFGAVAVGFLLGALPVEVRRVAGQVADGGPAGACRDTPFEDAAAALGDRIGDVDLSGRQRVNLLLVLLIAQAVQVLLLAVAVFAFFLLFGLVAIGDHIVEVWTGAPPTPLYLWGALRIGGPVSNELFQVSVFLAAFSGLYFTVYAVSDSTYREQFFSRVSRDLERAVGVRAVYQALTR